MLVDRRKPPPGERRLICQGDEATVSRIVGGKYDGMVERLQKTDVLLTRIEHPLKVWFGNDLRELTLNADAYYCLGKFIAGRIAHALHPEHLVNLRECRVFIIGNDTYVATYSDFVTDETNVITRRGDTLSIYHSLDDSSARERLRNLRDEQERAMAPGIIPAVEKLTKSGLAIAHPEANYHLADGVTVFFEIERIDLPALFSTITKIDDPLERARLISELSFLMAIVLAEKGKLKKHYFDNGSNDHSHINFSPQILLTMPMIYGVLQRSAENAQKIDAVILFDMLSGSISEIGVGITNAFNYLKKFNNELPTGPGYVEQEKLRVFFDYLAKISVRVCNFLASESERAKRDFNQPIPKGSEALLFGLTLMLFSKRLDLCFSGCNDILRDVIKKYKAVTGSEPSF